MSAAVTACACSLPQVMYLALALAARRCGLLAALQLERLPLAVQLHGE